MARSTLAMVTLLLASACSTAGVAPDVTVEPGTPFRLKPGQIAVVAADGVQIGFDGVTADSRCPRGERCVWAGDATLRVWLARRGGPRESGELHTVLGQPRSLTAAGHALQLVRLDPTPVSGRSLEPASYVATFALDPSGFGTERE